jgi:ribosomal protein L21E
VVYPRYVAGDRVWVKVKDKNQRSANPKLALTWERGTIVKRGVTGTSYRVDRPGRKRKKVITVNVQQLKPDMVQEERTEIAQPPPPVPPGEDKQQQPTNEHESEGEEEEYNMPDVDLGAEEEKSKEADPHFLDTMRERLAVLKDTPLPQQDTPLPGEQMPLPIEDLPLPETLPQSEGMMTRAQIRAGGGKIRHVPSTRATRQQVHMAHPPPPARESTGQAHNNRH